MHGCRQGNRDWPSKHLGKLSTALSFARRLAPPVVAHEAREVAPQRETANRQRLAGRRTAVRRRRRRLHEHEAVLRLLARQVRHQRHAYGKVHVQVTCQAVGQEGGQRVGEVLQAPRGRQRASGLAELLG